MVPGRESLDAWDYLPPRKDSDSPHTWFTYVPQTWGDHLATSAEIDELLTAAGGDGVRQHLVQVGMQDALGVDLDVLGVADELRHAVAPPREIRLQGHAPGLVEPKGVMATPLRELGLPEAERGGTTRGTR